MQNLCVVKNGSIIYSFKIQRGELRGNVVSCLPVYELCLLVDVVLSALSAMQIEVKASRLSLLGRGCDSNS